MMERLTVFETDKGRYSVRPIDWEGIWDKQGKIQEKGFNHTGIFQEKEDAEFFARTKNLEEEGKLLKLPCKPGDTVYMIKDDCEFNGDCHQTRTCKSCEYRNVLIEEDIATLKFIVENIDKFGKTVFLTEQEANEALERMK